VSRPTAEGLFILLRPTAEGLFILLHRSSYAVRLLNLLTGQVTDLPPATTLLCLYRMSSIDDPAKQYDLREEFKLLAAGLADDSTFAVYFRGPRMLVVAKPGDESWTLVDDQKRLGDSLPISFEGRFYCPTNQGLMVVETSANKPPQLVLVAEVPKVFPRRLCTLYLVENGGELILVYRNFKRSYGKDYIEYKVYRVDLKAMDRKHIFGLGGRAIFIGLRSAISVSASLFPSIESDSIYVGSANSRINGLYCLMDGASDPCVNIFEHDDYDEECG
jgi:hypothetical protein